MSERFPSTPHRQSFRKAVTVAEKCGPDCACQQEDALTIEITTEEQE